MKWKTLDFNAETVQAIKKGEKVQTRRAFKIQPPKELPFRFLFDEKIANFANDDALLSIFFPYGDINERLEIGDISIKIINVRCERLNDITPADCVCEGYVSDTSKHYAEEELHALEWFRRTWESIYPNGYKSWDANPWVWVIEFEVSE